MKVFIGLSEIAGYYKGLKHGFDELNIPATFITLSNHPFQYGGEDHNLLVKCIKSCATKRRQTPTKKIITIGLYIGIEIFLRLILFIKSLLTHDAFIFGFNSSFLFLYDLPILKLFKKKIIYQYHGSDSRPPYLDGFILNAMGIKKNINACIKEAKKKKRIIKFIEKYADIIVNIPPQAYFHERDFVLWLRIGLPCYPTPTTTLNDVMRKETDEVRILHSPSQPEAKGTPLIEKAINNLKGKGLKITFTTITNQPNDIVIKELQYCDFIVDQLYADYGMPGFPTEAAWFGKPAVIGGYAKNLWEKLLPEELLPPTLYCHPDDLEQAIEKMVLDKEYRLSLGKKARIFVETHWNPRKIAECYLRLIKGNFPQEWLYDPKKIDYCHGVGLTETQAREMLKSIIEFGGKKSLQLQDKPELEHRLINFAYGGNCIC